jgi:hypothetical protein
MEYRRSLMSKEPFIEEPFIEEQLIEEQMDKTQYTGTAFSYYESIQEFNQCRYGGLSYSMYHIWNHLLHLICRCRR